MTSIGGSSKLPSDRYNFANIEKEDPHSNQKIGIKKYNFIQAFFANLVGKQFSFNEGDQKLHLNKNSAIKFIKSNHDRFKKAISEINTARQLNNKSNIDLEKASGKDLREIFYKYLELERKIESKNGPEFEDADDLDEDPYSPGAQLTSSPPSDSFLDSLPHSRPELEDKNLNTPDLTTMTLGQLKSELDNWKNQRLSTSEGNNRHKEIAAQKILDAFSNRQTELRLDGLKIKTLPSCIGALQSLKTLNLSACQITELPKEVGQLNQLEQLMVNRNDLKVLPDEIGNLSQLKILNLADNLLTELSKEIGKLTQLQSLDVYANHLQTIPEEIGRLVELQQLNLFNNQLRAISPEIGNLKQLKILNLGKNPQLALIPRQLADLSHLQSLFLPESCRNEEFNRETIQTLSNRHCKVVTTNL